MASNPMQQFSVHKIGPEINLGGNEITVEYSKEQIINKINNLLDSTLH